MAFGNRFPIWPEREDRPGGILSTEKVTAEIAAVHGVQQGADILSFPVVDYVNFIRIDGGEWQ